MSQEFFDFGDIDSQRNVSIHLRNLSNDDLKLLNEVLQVTGHKTQSKAIMDAYSGFLLYKRKYADLERRYLDLVKKRNT